MIKSMTGYGKCSKIINSREYQVEIRSINHRYSDVSIRIPKSVGYLENDIRKTILTKASRGKIYVFVTFIDNSENANEVKINKQIAKTYIKELKGLAKESKISSNIKVTEILKLPDVFTVSYNNNDESIKTELLSVVDEALDNLIKMRQVEGSKIKQDLLERIKKVEEKTNKIEARSSGLTEEYITKLEEKIKKILNIQEVDKARLAQEIVIYADKCSVEEEVTRLKSHIYQFKNLLESGSPIGKKIDFLIQEMNRETNTIGSKANNLEITDDVVEIKTELEDIREQIQNIE